MLKYFTGSIISTVVGLILACGVGYYYSGTTTGALQALFIATILAVLEVSLSFDNAIVNAIVLKEMTPVWRQRFITWGMLIAVFGMRLVFPLAIVAVVGKIDPWSALKMAALQPDQYAALMSSAHLGVAAFGGTFLLMVTLRYFYDETKDVHWIAMFERPLSKLGKLDEIEIGLTLLTLTILCYFIPEDAQKLTFLLSGMAGLITYVVVDGIGGILEMSQENVKDMHKASAGMFLYLEVLDASFSFDGVIGAFAITHNLFIIMIGLSIGAFFVRSLTIMFVEQETLTKFLYLEHGAFYAIGCLAMIMLMDPFLHIPEWVTGLLGGLVILIAFYWSIRFPEAPSRVRHQESEELPGSGHR
ncbi:DUF475 domain-containing protein [Bdellovibrio sp. HCB337]|uniref:DUF475 domain-containing protein n=1 Tax=Bdellovibrio sp. HCB337 TaxID=3394358 RepID=UPI0039A48039